LDDNCRVWLSIDNIEAQGYLSGAILTN
jgi:hypothetical protein